MKKLFKIVITLVLLLAVAAVAVPFLVPAEKYKAEIVRAVKDATGRDLVIAGAMSAKIFPGIGVKAGKVSFSNPKGYTASNMLEVEELDVNVALLPLLSGAVEVKRLVLTRPLIELEVSVSGVPNWRFTPYENEPPVKNSGLFISSAHAAEPGVRELMLQDVKIVGGTLHYRDQQTKKHYKAEDLNASASLNGLRSPLAFSADTVVNGEKINMEARIDTPDALMRGERAAVAMKLSGAPLHFVFEGQSDKSIVSGNLAVETPSLPKLSGWLGSPMEWKGKAPLALAAKGKLHCNSSQCELKEANVKLDDTPFTGRLGADIGGSVPMIAADLTGDRLDLTSYLPEEKKALGGFIAPAYAAEGTGWSQEKLDLSALRAANGEIALKLKTLQLRAAHMEDVALKADWKGGLARLSLPNVKLYNGTGWLETSVDASSATPTIMHGVKLSGVQLGPLLKDLFQSDRLSGTAEMAFSVSGSGASQQAIMSSLSGSGSARITDGAIKGANLAEMVRNVKSAFSNTGGLPTPERSPGFAQAGAQSTDFAELGGTFTIAGGVLKNNDLAMKAQLLRVSGAGEVDIGQRIVRYRVKPEVVASLKGQGGKDKQGLEIPVLIEGPFEHLSYRADLQGAAQDALKDPEKAKESVKAVKEQLKEIRKNPDAVKDLLKGLR